MFCSQVSLSRMVSIVIISYPANIPQFSLRFHHIFQRYSFEKYCSNANEIVSSITSALCHSSKCRDKNLLLSTTGADIAPGSNTCCITASLNSPFPDSALFAANSFFGALAPLKNAIENYGISFVSVLEWICRKNFTANLSYSPINAGAVMMGIYGGCWLC